MRSFAYDATQQLTGGGYAGAPESYAHDPEGNRTASHLSASYSHDAANRLREDANTCYDYDANGNLVTRRAKVGLDCTDTSGAATTYEWDVLNRLVRIDFPDATYAAYRYDAQGRRIEKDVNGALTRYVYDADASLLEYDETGALLATYSHGDWIDQPLVMTRTGQSFFYHTDHLGSVRLLTDAAGAVANSYDYDSFGNLEPTSFETVSNPYAFTARERDAESGLMLYRARYYDPHVGRFVSQDPLGYLGGDGNLYRYVFGNPVNFVDPLGLFRFPKRGTAFAEYLATWDVSQTASAGLASVGTSTSVLFGRVAAALAAVAILTAPTPANDNEPGGSGGNGRGQPPGAGSGGNGDDECEELKQILNETAQDLLQEKSQIIRQGADQARIARLQRDIFFHNQSVSAFHLECPGYRAEFITPFLFAIVVN